MTTNNSTIFNINEEKLSAFVSFICERRLMQLNRRQSSWPAMNLARINNVYREHDRYSLWEQEHLSIRNVIVGRFFMSIPATKYARDLASCGFLEDEGLLFNPCVEMTPPDGMRQAEVAEIFLHSANRVIDMITTWPKEMVVDHALTLLTDHNQNKDLRAFRRYEIKTSLSYLNQTDFFEDSFFHVGPGAAGKCEEIFGAIPVTLDEMEDVKNVVKERLIDCGFRFAEWPKGKKWAHRNPNKFTVRQLEDCLCEYRKYCRSFDHWQRGVALPAKYRYVPHSRPHTA